MVYTQPPVVDESTSEKTRRAARYQLYVDMNNHITQENELRIRARWLFIQANDLLVKANELSIENHAIPRIELRLERDHLRAQAFELIREAMRLKAHCFAG
jgi:uncharacterized protein YacL (UPF0231 family)